MHSTHPNSELIEKAGQPIYIVLNTIFDEACIQDTFRWIYEGFAFYTMIYFQMLRAWKITSLVAVVLFAGGKVLMG
jgi:hypothetical protein